MFGKQKQRHEFFCLYFQVNAYTLHEIHWSVPIIMFCFFFDPKKEKKNFFYFISFPSANSINLASFWGKNCHFFKLKNLTKKPSLLST